MSDTPFAPKAPGEHAGDVIDRYTLVEPLGEGGMGTVWRATQSEPVKREVALKIVKLGMDTREVVQRFEAERQALALMDHPGIAKVFDGGATASGRPYFVMELVQGAPITKYCDVAKLELRARLELFREVCDAVQHAHHKGVIHRDLKPSNVLVATDEHGPVPKVIDFGIAKATSARLSEATMQTELGQIVGTPEYMAPEQSLGDGTDVDTRADVYSLGVLLYELLTGAKTFDVKRALATGFHELLRQIREVDPAKPSTRILSLGDSATTIAMTRGSDATTLSRRLRGDLDWVVMRALEKNRERRYDTPAALAEDVGRYLSNEPVEAAPPSAAYRFRKFVVRRKKTVAAVAVMLLLLLGGVVGTTSGLLWALSEKEHANQAAETALESAASEQKARGRSEAILQFVVETLGKANVLHEGGSKDKTVVAAMEEALVEIDAGRFSDDPEVEAELLSTIANIVSANGRAPEAAPLHVRALTILRALHGDDASDQTSGALINYANTLNDLGRWKEAEELLREALAMVERLGSSDTERVVATEHLASALGSQGRYAEAEGLQREALELQRKISDVDSSTIAVSMMNHGVALLRLDRFQDAAPELESALEMLRAEIEGDDVRIALVLSSLASVYTGMGREEDALERYHTALEMQQRLFEGDHPFTALAHTNYGNSLIRNQRFEEAERELVAGLEMFVVVYTENHLDVARGLSFLASLYLKMGRQNECEEYARRSVELYRRLESSDNATYASALLNLGAAHLARGKEDLALPVLDESLEMFRRLGALESFDAGECMNQNAMAAWRRGDSERAIALYEELLAIRERVLGRAHESTMQTILNLGINYRDGGRAAEAVPLIEEARAFHEGKPMASTLDLVLMETYGLAHDRDKALAHAEKFVANVHATLPEGSPNRATFEWKAGEGLLRAGAPSEAEPLLVSALEPFARNAPKAWTTLVIRAQLGKCAIELGRGQEGAQQLIEVEPEMRALLSKVAAALHLPYRECLETLAAYDETTGDPAAAQRWRDAIAEFDAAH